MNKILIAGCSGAGKSTLSKALNEISGIPIYPMDNYYFNENWKGKDDDTWEKIVKDIASKDAWITDGNYSRTMKYRLEKADVAIFLDASTWTCMYRVIRRTLKYYGKERPGMVKGCKERFDLQFLHYVTTYNMVRRKKIMGIIESYSDQVEIVILRNKKEIQAYLDSIPRT